LISDDFELVFCVEHFYEADSDGFVEIGGVHSGVPKAVGLLIDAGLSEIGHF